MQTTHRWRKDCPGQVRTIALATGIGKLRHKREVGTLHAGLSSVLAANASVAASAEAFFCRSIQKGPLQKGTGLLCYPGDALVGAGPRMPGGYASRLLATSRTGGLVVRALLFPAVLAVYGLRFLRSGLRGFPIERFSYNVLEGDGSFRCCHGLLPKANVAAHHARHDHCI